MWIEVNNDQLWFFRSEASNFEQYLNWIQLDLITLSLLVNFSIEIMTIYDFLEVIEVILT